MEKAVETWDQKVLIEELTQGKELAMQLQVHLNVASSSLEAKEILVKKIMRSYDKALSVLKWNGSSPGAPESPGSLAGSPLSDDSDHDNGNNTTRDATRKRMNLPKWTQQVQVCPGTGLEGPLDDGHSWRKYGQKYILGAQYPRGYYRCTHRPLQGCLATKQVQRSDEDPTIFDITYRGKHICTHSASLSSPSSSVPIFPRPPPDQIQEPNPTHDHHHPFNHHHNHKMQQSSQEILINFQTCPKVVITRDSNTPINQEQPFSSLVHFPNSTSTIENNSIGISLFPPSMLSPSGSGSNPNYFSMSPTQGFGCGNQNVHTSDSEFSDMVSGVTSAADLDYPFSPMDFDTSFEFDPNLFSS